MQMLRTSSKHNIRRYNHIMDYKKISEWWNKRDSDPIPSNLLPAIGYIVDECCAGWLYKTDSDFCLIEWIVSDPSSDKIERDEALDVLIDTLENEAKKQGFTVMFTSISRDKTPHLEDRMKKHDFVLGDENMANYIKRID